MKTTTTGRHSWCLLAIGVLLSILCLIPGISWGGIPNLTFEFSTSENALSVTSPAAQGGVSLSSGGAICTVTITAKPAVMVAYFGQPFSGPAYFDGAFDSLIAKADQSYAKGAAFLQDPTILKTATGGLEGLTKKYSKQDLIDAEEAYRRALFVDPWDDRAVTGILKVRQAMVLHDNLVWDIRRRDQLRLRLTTDKFSDTADILKREIAILEEISSLEKGSVALILELFSDPVFRGPGALLRKDFSINDSNIFDSTMKLIFSSGRRFAETELLLANKKLLMSFFDYQKRADALSDLADAYAYLTELMRLVNPYINNSFYNNSEVLSLTSWQRKLIELASLTQQGYNPFGFLPDFVPFVKGSAENNNLSTFNAMHQLAEASAQLAYEKEAEARGQENKFAESSEEYEKTVLEVKSSYDQRLKSLIGVVSGDSGEEPDVFTYLVPDVDVDGDGKSERDKVREDMEKTYEIRFGAKGAIGEQYSTMAMADARIEAALNELSNNLMEIEIREETAQAIAEGGQEIIQLILESGEKESLLIREKGRLEEQFYRRKGDIEANHGLLGQGLAAGIEVAGAFAKYLEPKPKPTSSAAGNPSGEGRSLEQPPVGPQWVQVAIAVAGAIVSGINSANSARAAGDISRRQGQLMKELANIDAAINEIKVMTDAKITAINQKNELLRTLQETKILALKQANLELAVEIARRDYDREAKALQNKTDEATTLLVDLGRAIKLAEFHQEGVLGWMEQDVRDVLTNSVLIADEAFYRSQVWSFVALRALEYYANKPPETNGQPNRMISTLYQNLYAARRGQDLIELLAKMKENALSNFKFTLPGYACGQRGLLSLKYDVIVPTTVAYENKGQLKSVEKEALYTYKDPIDGQIYEGARAYQATFRDALRQGLTGIKPKRKLKLVFSTDLFPRRQSTSGTGESVSSNNPFYTKSGTNAKIIGFSDPNCSGGGLETGLQGIQVNLTGDLSGQSSGPWIKLAQVGTSYLKHSPWTDADFDTTGRLINPLKSIAVYSAYSQILPTWLIGDVDHNPSVPDPKEERIGSAVYAVFPALLGGVAVGGGQKTLEFTDRSVANDRWELEIDELENAVNSQFIENLDQMLKEPVGDSPSSDFLTDVQMWVGWAYRNPN